LLRVLFEPLVYFDATPYVDQGAVIVETVPIPPKKRGLLGTPYGLLVNEVAHAPAVRVDSGCVDHVGQSLLLAEGM
jgi:hypothetical protein